MSTQLGQRPPEEGNWRLRNWRVRARLVALILGPTAAAVLLGGFQVFASTGAAADFARTNQLAQLSQIGGLTMWVSGERARMSWFIARNRPASGLPSVREQMDQVAAVGQVRISADDLLLSVTGRTADQIQNMLDRLDQFLGLVGALDADLLPAASVELYSTVINDLLSVHNELIKGSQDDELFRQSMLDSLARAKESVSHQQALLTTVLSEGAFSQDQLKRFLGELSREENERKAFADEATAAERRIFDENVNGRSADTMLFLRELVLIWATAGQTVRGLDQGHRDDAGQWVRHPTWSSTPCAWSSSAGRGHRGPERGAQRRRAAARVRDRGRGDRALRGHPADHYRVAGSLVRPLRRLRAEALEVAGTRLPETVRMLRESGDSADARRGAPIGVTSTDEIGEVARAFDQVHREAVRLAADEATLRGNVNAMFVNLSRRSQSLVERQLCADRRPGAGRAGRRAGWRTCSGWTTWPPACAATPRTCWSWRARRPRAGGAEPVPLVDVVRAALSEIEHYERVSSRSSRASRSSGRPSTTSCTCWPS